jgi:rfaE bifunctional protein nucleotidyltransferase chain/domain
MTVSLKKLKNSLKNSKDKKIVLATGCFDVLHKAHKSFLTAAEKQGDLFIVGLEQDKRVEELKGKGRPVNKFKIRTENLTSLGFIDFIFPMPIFLKTKKDYLDLLWEIKPDILAVSENTPFLKNKKELIEKAGGRLFIFPFNKKYSTTKVLTKKGLAI